MVADRKLSEAELFQVVGAGWKQQGSEKRKKTFREKLKGKPVFSMVLLFLIVLGCVFANVVANHDPSGFYLQNLNTPPGKEFIFGTDSLGRDIYSLIWYGGRVSLVIGLLGAAIITVIGVTYGCISGTAGPKVDSVLMRFTEMCGSIPTLLLILILSAVLQANDVISISVIIGITGWFALARIVRSEVRQIRNSDYVMYARLCGGSFGYVMYHHLIPNFVSAIMFVVISSISSCITMESTLSFSWPRASGKCESSWGGMLSLANKALIMNTWWVIVIPGVFLVITLMCITSMGSFVRSEVNNHYSTIL